MYGVQKAAVEACVVVAERLTAVGKQDSACVYKDWRHLPRATRVASLSGRVVPLLVILDNEKKTPFQCMHLRFQVINTSFYASGDYVESINDSCSVRTDARTNYHWIKSWDADTFVQDWTRSERRVFGIVENGRMDNNEISIVTTRETPSASRWSRPIVRSEWKDIDKLRGCVMRASLLKAIASKWSVNTSIPMSCVDIVNISTQREWILTIRYLDIVFTVTSSTRRRIIRAN